MSEPGTADSADAPLGGAVWRVARVAIFGGLLATLDATIVNVSLETMQQSLRTDLATVQWVSTGYLLALALALPLSGWLVERLGATRLYLGCPLGFTAASAMCGLAPTVGVLIAFRVAQGAVGGLLAPLGQTLVAQVAGPERLGRVMSIVALPTLLSPILGPTVGGLIVSHASWRWVFLVNVPIGLLGAWLARRRLPASHPRPARRPDLLGLALISPGLALVIFAVSRVGQTGQLHDPIALIAGGTGLVLVVGFVGYSAHYGGAAILNVRLFANRAFAAGTAVSFLGRLTSDGGLLLLPLYYQQVRGASPLLAGLLLAPQGLGALAALPVAGRATDHHGPRQVAVTGAALGLLAAIPLTGLTEHTSYLWLCGVLLVRGFGASLAGLPPVAAAYQTLQPAQVPKATTTLNVAQRLGSPIGTAVLAVVLATLTARGDPDPAELAHVYATTFVVAAAAATALLTASFLLPGPPASRQPRP